jgi:plastocyanin
MKRLSLLVTLSVVALLTLVPAAGAQQDQGVVAVPLQYAWSVSIEDFYFEPADAAVEPGSTITWINYGTVPHTVTADDGAFDSGVLNPGDSFTVAFQGQGTITYHCAIHPSMMGSVTVGEGVAATDGASMPAAPTDSGY